MSKFRTVIILLLLSHPAFSDSWPTFDLSKASRHQLPLVKKITITKDPVYKTLKNYLAYPLTDIIIELSKKKSLPLESSLIIFTAADGYKVTMSYQDALLENGYVAFKDLSAKNGSWVEFKFGDETITPAPYYLIWPNTKLDKWRYPSPFQLTSISIQSVNSYFSTAAPISNDTKAIKGFILFSRYCIRCHSVNHTGGNLGPELNLPNNITDLFSAKKLTDFILDASTFKPNTKMPIFKNIISSRDTLAIQHYLKSMKSLTKK